MATWEGLPLIAQDEIKKVNKKVQIPLLLGQWGCTDKVMELRPHLEYRTACWFRGGDNPSGLGITFYPDQQKWYCTDFTQRTFTSIDLLDFATKHLNIPFKRAIEDMVFASGDELDLESMRDNATVRKSLDTPQPMNTEVMSVFKYGLHPYWYKRGYTPEIAKEFMLGYSFDYPMNNRLIIPILDEMNNLVAVQGRAMDDFEVPKYRFLDGTGESAKIVLYNGRKAYENVQEMPVKWLGVVESANSVWRAYQYGYKNFVATLSTNVTARQQWLIKQFNCPVMIMFDYDEVTGSGQAAAGILARSLIDKGIEVYLCNIGFHADPSDLTHDQFNQTIANALKYQ
jgi:DNA primase